MKTLIVEDDFTSRKMLQGLLLPYGHCDIVVNGKEAIEAFLLAWKENHPYDLICLDIMLPVMDGQETLKEIRRLEAERGLHGLSRVKIIMITALGDTENIMEAFKGQCEAYLVKPIDKEKLLKEIRPFGFLDKETNL
jgi:two-component system, chemotaxis family, chemotaxis protein CheY